MGVEDLKKLMLEVKEHEKLPNVEAREILTLIESKLAELNGINSIK